MDTTELVKSLLAQETEILMKKSKKHKHKDKNKKADEGHKKHKKRKLFSQNKTNHLLVTIKRIFINIH